MWFVLFMWQCPTNITDYNGAQKWTIILWWWTWWCNTLRSSNGVVRWGILACSTRETLCTSVPLRRAGHLLPPLLLMSPPSKHGWGLPGRTRNIYRGCGKGDGGQVGHLVAQEEDELWRQEDWQHILSNQPISVLLVGVNCSLGILLQLHCRVQWSGESYNQTNSLYQIRPCWAFKPSHTISKCVDVASGHLRKAPTIWRWAT